MNMFMSNCFALRYKKRKKKKEKQIKLVYGNMHLSTYIRYIHPVFIHGHTYTLSLAVRPVTLSLSLSALSLLTLFPSVIHAKKGWRRFKRNNWEKGRGSGGIEWKWGEGKIETTKEKGQRYRQEKYIKHRWKKREGN